MTKEIYISSTPHETRLAIVEDEQLVEIHYERENEYSLAGSMYKGKVTRVLPGMQSAFVDIGLERDAFLYVTDFLEDQEDSGEFERTALPPPPAKLAAKAAKPAAAVETAQPAAPEAGEGQALEDREAGGARRWRGRRGRKRDREAAAPAAQPAVDEGQSSRSVDFEITSDDFEQPRETATLE
jgi:Ribonuclease G/E